MVDFISLFSLFSFSLPSFIFSFLNLFSLLHVDKPVWHKPRVWESVTYIFYDCVWKCLVCERRMDISRIFSYCRLSHIFTRPFLHTHTLHFFLTVYNSRFLVCIFADSSTLKKNNVLLLNRRLFLLKVINWINLKFWNIFFLYW